MSRTKKEFDWSLLNSLATNGASIQFIACEYLRQDNQEENSKSIASKCKYLVRQIKDRHEMNFLEFREKKEEVVRVRLIQKQRELALAGNVTLLIWLGKQMLGQSDKSQLEIDDKSLSEKIKAARENSRSK